MVKHEGRGTFTATKAARSRFDLELNPRFINVGKRNKLPKAARSRAQLQRENRPVPADDNVSPSFAQLYFPSVPTLRGQPRSDAADGTGIVEERTAAGENLNIPP
jgi:hypothetical protein